MTTNCDLEEMKHIAQQKFIELVDSGVVFERCGKGWEYGDWYFEFEKYEGSARYDIFLMLASETVCQSKYTTTKNLTAVAARRATKRALQAEDRSGATEAVCKALQEALKDTATTLAPEVQTGNTEAYSASEEHSDTPSVGEWFVIRYGGSEMEVCILEVRDDAVKWGKPSWLVSDGTWAKTWEFKEKVRVSLGIGKPRRWGWWRMTSRDLFFPYSRPKP